MKRIVLAVVVIVLVVGVALPPLFGARARSLLEAELAFLGERMAPYGTVEIAFEDWDVGWYSSTATLAVVVAIADRPDVPRQLVDLPAFSRTFPKAITLRHGPVVTGPAAGMGWGSVELVVDASLIPALRQFQEATGLDHVARMGISAGLLGSLTLGLEVPAFADESGEQRLDFRGLEANAVIDGAGEDLEVDGEFGGLTVTSSAAQLAAVGRVSWSAGSRLDSRYPNLWLGGGRIDLDRAMLFGGEAGEFFEIVDVRLEGESSIVEDRYLVAGLHQAEELRVMDRRLSQPVLEIAMGLSADAVARLLATGYAMDAMTPEEQLEIATALLRGKTTFEIKRLAFDHEDRSATASLTSEFRGDELPDGFEFDAAADWAALLPLVTANLDVAFHRELLVGLGLGQMDPLAQVLAREGILLESGDDYTLTVGFGDGVLTVNGEPFEPFELLGLLN